MTKPPTAGDIRTYLETKGWRQAVIWRSATVWSTGEGDEVLVPAHDQLGDFELRVRQILRVLSEVEGRDETDISDEIGSPYIDVQIYRTAPLSTGYVPLGAGLRALQGVRSLISAAARTVVEGAAPAFAGPVPRVVGQFLDGVELGRIRDEGHEFMIRIPLSDTSENGSRLGRRVAEQVFASAVAARTAISSDDRSVAFEEAGVSADFCEALSKLAGPHRHQPFEVGFRWARGVETNLPIGPVRFDADEGQILHEASKHLRQLSVAGVAQMTALVESLHGRQGSGRWTIKLKGNLRTSTGRDEVRSVSAVLGDQRAYDTAFRAHRASMSVRVTGELSGAKGRLVVATIDVIEDIND